MALVIGNWTALAVLASLMLIFGGGLYVLWFRYLGETVQLSGMQAQYATLKEEEQEQEEMDRHTKREDDVVDGINHDDSDNSTTRSSNFTSDTI